MGKGAAPKEQEVALEEVQEERWLSGVGGVAAAVMSGVQFGVRFDGGREQVTVLAFGAWSLMLRSVGMLSLGHSREEVAAAAVVAVVFQVKQG